MVQDDKRYDYRESIELLKLWTVWLWSTNTAKLNYPSVSAFYSSVATYGPSGEINSDAAEKIESIITNKMPEYFRVPIIWRYHKKMAFEEMAERLKISISTLKKRRLYGGHIWLQARIENDTELMKAAHSIITLRESKPVAELI